MPDLASEDRSFEVPSIEAPSAEAPSIEVPSTETPSTEVPSTETPSAEDPASDEASADAMEDKTVDAGAIADDARAGTCSCIAARRCRASWRMRCGVSNMVLRAVNSRGALRSPNFSSRRSARAVVSSVRRRGASDMAAAPRAFAVSLGTDATAATLAAVASNTAAAVHAVVAGAGCDRSDGSRRANATAS